MVAHAKASSCVPPWCRRLSELTGVSEHAADNLLGLLAAGTRDRSKVGAAYDVPGFGSAGAVSRGLKSEVLVCRWSAKR